MYGPWLLPIYTVPAEPARKRAAIWPKVMKLGRLYVRDDVCNVPERLWRRSPAGC